MECVTVLLLLNDCWARKILEREASLWESALHGGWVRKKPTRLEQYSKVPICLKQLKGPNLENSLRGVDVVLIQSGYSLVGIPFDKLVELIHGISDSHLRILGVGVTANQKYRELIRAKQLVHVNMISLFPELMAGAL